MEYTAARSKWEVRFTQKAVKQAKKLNLAIKGPSLHDSWPNYGKLVGKKNQDRRHCHLVKGKPTYICCWKLVDKKIKIIEVYYVGTHENAPY